VKNYWRDLPSVLVKQTRLHDIARKDYEVKNLIVPDNLEDQDQKVDYLCFVSNTDIITMMFPYIFV